MKRFLLICAAAAVLYCIVSVEGNTTPADKIKPTTPQPEESGEEPIDMDHIFLEEPVGRGITPAERHAGEDCIPTEKPAEKNYIYKDEDSFFYVVNKTYLLPEDYEIRTDFVQGEYVMEKTAAKHMREMIAAAKEDGISLKILSAYRTVEYQKRLFERNVKSRMAEDGMSYEQAFADTAINIAPPGGSEHNAGLAADIVTEEDWDTYTGFEGTDEFAWLQAHATEYGYILRYPKGKEDITGYIYEPWHYRYVGVKYARDVMDSGLCLEEYFEKYVWVDGKEPSFPFGS